MHIDSITCLSYFSLFNNIHVHRLHLIFCSFFFSSLLLIREYKILLRMSTSKMKVWKKKQIQHAGIQKEDFLSQKQNLLKHAKTIRHDLTYYNKKNFFWKREHVNSLHLYYLVLTTYKRFKRWWVHNMQFEIQSFCNT